MMELTGNCRKLTRERPRMIFFFFLNDTAPTEISTLPLHDALPISSAGLGLPTARGRLVRPRHHPLLALAVQQLLAVERHGVVVDLVDELVELALLEIPLVERLGQVGEVGFRDDTRPF